MSGHGHSHEHSAHGQSHGHDLEAPLLKGHAEEGHDELEEDKTKLRRAVLFAAFFMLVEIVGGIMSNSLAIITDAAHMLSDVGGFIVSYVALELAGKARNDEYTYGFKQAEVLGALLSISIVWGLTAVLLWEAVPRFVNPQEIEGRMMFIISVIGFVVNLVLMKVLGHGHSHGDGGDHGHSHGGHGGHGGHGDHGGHEDHGHSHGGSSPGGSSPGGGGKKTSVALDAAIAHVIGDIVQSLGVCLASFCIWMQPWQEKVGCVDSVQSDGNTVCVSRWNYADPCCTVLFGILVLWTTKSTFKFILESLMVRAPRHMNQAKLTKQLEALPNVDGIHDLHVWCLGSKDVLCTAHIMVSSRNHFTKCLEEAIKVAQDMGIFHSTFQIEISGEFDPTKESYGLHGNPMRSGASAAPKAGGNGHGHDQGHAGHGVHDEGPDGCCHGHGNGLAHEEKEQGHSHGGGHGHAH